MKENFVQSLAEPVGSRWLELQKKYTKSGVFNIAFPLSSTPLPIFAWVNDHALQFPRWNKVNFILMDEMLESDPDTTTYVATDDPASYEKFLNDHFLIDLQRTTGININILKPKLDHLTLFYPHIHLLILAIGVNGNYANVMSGTPLDTSWHIAHLTPEFRQAHTQAGSSSYAGAEFREYGMSLGPQQVLQARSVIVIASGDNKRELVKQLRSMKTFDPEFPISIIYQPEVADRVELYFTEDTFS